MLSFNSIQRWLRDDGEWAGSFYVTKNHLDPALRVGYQPASQYSNYNATIAYHLAEAYHVRQSEIPERPAPCEIGGYIIQTDSAFGSLVANAGGMQIVVNLRGDSVPKYGEYWTPLGMVRISQPNWDSRLGPSDGARDRKAKTAATVAPTWKDGKRWVTLADAAQHYRGVATIEEVIPERVAFAVTWAPVTGVGGPAFLQKFEITEEFVTTFVESSHDVEFGLTVPLLVDDGLVHRVDWSDDYIHVRSPRNDNRQLLTLLNNTNVEKADPVQSAYGSLLPLRLTSEDGQVGVIISPRPNLR
jgi:hypothetical protein